MENLYIVPEGSGIKTKKHDSSEFGYSGRVYLHGRLEDMAGYDICNITIKSLKESGLGKEMPVVSGDKDDYCISRDKNGAVVRWWTPYIPEAEIEVKVEGVNEPCVGIFWLDRSWAGTEIEIDGKKELAFWSQCGRICLRSDYEAIRTAREQQKRGF